MMETIAQYLRFYLQQPLFIQRLKSNAALPFMKELRNAGVAVLNDFISPELCDAYRKNIDTIIEENPNRVTRRSDERIYGIERISDVLSDYAKHPFFQIMEHLYTTHTKLGFLLAARMRYREDNQGSGEGWHRDSFVYRLKAILYLSDVDESNGPFEYLLGTHRLSSVLKVNQFCKQAQTRFEDNQIEALKRKYNLQSKRFLAKKGTLILADTSGIHRGVPMLSAERYALTHYYFAERMIGDELNRKFEIP